MSKSQPTRLAFFTVSELARRQGYGLIVTNGKTWLIRGLSWRSMRTEDVAAYLAANDPRKAPSEAKNESNGGEDTPNTAVI